MNKTPELGKMVQLLKDVLCVIKTFRTYAQEDGGKATLTCTELRQLIQGEFGDVLQPRAIHAVERDLNLLDTDSSGSISFDDFVLAIFNVLNLCYLDIQSLLESEPRQVSKPDDTGLQVTSGTGQWAEQTPPTQDRVAPPSRITSSAQLNPTEREAVGHRRVANTKTYKLPVEEPWQNDPRNQHLEGDQQSQEVAQDVSATGDSGAQPETNKPTAESEQTGSPTKQEGQDRESPMEADKSVREQSMSKTRDRFGEQEGNLRTQNSPPEKETQSPSKDQEVATEKGVKEHSKTQELSLPGKYEPSLEHADLPKHAAAQKPLQTEKLTDPEDDSRTSEIQGEGEDANRTPPETKNPDEHGDEGRASEIQGEGEDANRTPPETKNPDEHGDEGRASEIQGEGEDANRTPPETKNPDEHGDEGRASEIQGEGEDANRTPPETKNPDEHGDEGRASEIQGEGEDANRTPPETKNPDEHGDEGRASEIQGEGEDANRTPPETKNPDEHGDEGRASEIQGEGEDANRTPPETKNPDEHGDEGRASEIQGEGEDANRTPPETKNPDEHGDEGRASETQEPPAQEKEQETKDLPVQGDNKNVSETSDVRAVRKEGRGPEAHGTEGQEEKERKIQLLTLEDQPQDGKYQELQESSKKRDTGAVSKTQELSSEGGDQNHIEIERTVTPEEEARHAEEGTEKTLMRSKNAPAAGRTPDARERTQELAPLKNQSGEENKRVPKTHDKPVKDDDGYQGEDPKPTATQNNGGSSEIPNGLTLEDGDSSSETTDVPVQRDSQNQGDPLRTSMNRSHNNGPDAEKEVALGEERRAEEAVVLAVGVKGEDEQLTEEPEWAAREEHRSLGSGTKGSGPAVYPSGHPEAQEPTARGEDRKSLETEIPGTLEADFTDQFSIRQLSAKEDSKRKLKVQGPSTKGEEGRTPETQEAPVKNLDEGNSAPPRTHLEREDPTQELAEADTQRNPAEKRYDVSVPQAGLEEKTQMGQEPGFVEGGTVYSSPLYQYLQEKILQQKDMTQTEQQNEAGAARSSSPGLPNYRSSASLTRETSGCPIIFSDSQALPRYTRDYLPDADPADAQRTSAPKASEDKQGHPQEKKPVLQREASTKKP